MAFVHGRNGKVLVAQFDLSAYLNNHEVNQEADLPETSCFGDSARRYGVVGLKTGSVSLGGFYDPTVVSGDDVVLSAALGAASTSPVTIGPNGLAVGERVKMLAAREKTYKVNGSVDSPVMVSAEMQCDAGIDNGVSLHALTAETATGNSASVDNAAATANGGVAHLHTTAIGGTPTDDRKVQHSTNDSVWVDLVTFTQVTAVGSQRIEVAAGTTVNRYLRETRTIGGGSPSSTTAVSFARR